tara:strand:+ start:71 stop:436 length:366 start_codon:yes stop_codon:yes gene_type:complete
MGVTDRRVRVPGTNIKVKHHRVLAAVARYLKENESAITDELMYNATMRNGRPIFHYVKGVRALTKTLSIHPHFASYKDKVNGRPKSHWFLADTDTYLLGEGQAFPSEYYDSKTNKRKPEAF